MLQIEHGSLYPALHRLQNRGWIASFWGTSENNRKAKFYELTAAGRKLRTRATTLALQVDARALRAVNPDEITLVLATLKRLRGNLAGPQSRTTA